jgi:ATP-dependent helicase/DNAse subunit B
MKGLTPCSSCDYRSLCRIDPRLNRYKVIQQTQEKELRKTLSAGDGQEVEA